MPLQAGNNDLLKRMKRLYTVESFLDIVDELRSTVPHIGLTTDIIVGFPGETEEEFEGTLDMMRKIRFDGAYMFRYSPRPGTPAADMEQVPAEASRARLQKLIEVQNAIGGERNRELVGRELKVLVEGRSRKNPEMLQGYTPCFRMAHFKGDAQKLKGETVPVRVVDGHRWGVSAEVV